MMKVFLVTILLALTGWAVSQECQEEEKSSPTVNFKGEQCPGLCPPPAPNPGDVVCPPTYDENGCRQRDHLAPSLSECTPSEYTDMGCRADPICKEDEKLCDKEFKGPCREPGICIKKTITNGTNGDWCQNYCNQIIREGPVKCPNTYDSNGCLNPANYVSDKMECNLHVSQECNEEDKLPIENLKGEVCPSICPTPAPKKGFVVCPPTYDENGCRQQEHLAPSDSECTPSAYNEMGCPTDPICAEDEKLCVKEFKFPCTDPGICIKNWIANENGGDKCQNYCNWIIPEGRFRCPDTYDSNGCRNQAVYVWNESECQHHV